ncbi:LMBR1 domain-containing protein 2 homolog A-like [Cucurbita moschata]|uniref:LMBR1 domain-containing protein 2 homolog A-like n=1 Tax=Cucurbita moschata TaxID=3662 RepID=A0A6J1HDX3_CUCMO|nr:LMBR1 domain-containing protein 2 homolog A-like [Cucurbita moschata]
MWVFYMISLPLTVGMVIVTLKYFAGPWVPRYVFLTVGYTWFCSISIIILVPADIWMTTSRLPETGVISFFWSWSYWSTFLLTWAVVPLIQGFEDAGDFTVKQRLKTSIRVNLAFYLVVGSIGLFGLILLIAMHKIWHGGVLGFAMACSNTFGLVTGAFLLGFGLSEIPKSIWRNADWTTRQKVFSHQISKMAVKLDDAHQELSNAIVVAQATSKQMSKRDPLRPYMNVIDNILTQMFREDPAFKPRGGQLGENDMDYDTDEKSMATLRRHLRRAREEYYRYKSQYMTYVMKALELEDTIKNYERRMSTGWKYVSTLRHARSGKLGSILDTLEFIWRCILRKHLQKVLAVILGIMSAAILLAEATLLPRVDLSLFSMLIKLVGREEVLVQAFAFVPLMYMCVCTYYSLFKFGTLIFYSLTPGQTSSVSLLLICSMVARYAPPISFNFLNLIRLDGNEKTVFEQRMGKIDDAVPFFGKGFNRIYPLIMVVYTILVASNFFNRVINFLGSWKRFRFQSEVDDMDGFDPSGVIILQKERSWFEQGHMVGEHVIPLARNFNGIDLESGSSNSAGLLDAKAKATKSLINEDMNGNSSKSSADEGRKYGSSREAMSNKYAVIREQIRQSSLDPKSVENMASANVILLDTVNGESSNTNEKTTSDLASKWESMKMGFQNFKANIGTKKFLPLQQIQETRSLSRLDSSQSLDEIFQRLKRPSDHGSHSDDEDGIEIKGSEGGTEIERSRPTR